MTLVGHKDSKLEKERFHLNDSGDFLLQNQLRGAAAVKVQLSNQGDMYVRCGSDSY